MCLPANICHIVASSHFKPLCNCDYIFSSYKAVSNVLFRLFRSLPLMKKHKLRHAYDVLGIHIFTEYCCIELTILSSCSERSFIRYSDRLDIVN